LTLVGLVAGLSPARERPRPHLIGRRRTLLLLCATSWKGIQSGTGLAGLAGLAQGNTQYLILEA
jgi:hypothetical protein